LLYSILKSSIYGFCPKCKKGSLFSRWSKLHERCNYCDIQFLKQNGDNWFFLLIIDRALFIFPIILLYYFNFNPYYIILLSLILLVFFIILTPIRIGISFGFEYYLKVKSGNN